MFKDVGPFLSVGLFQHFVEVQCLFLKGFLQILLLQSWPLQGCLELFLPLQVPSRRLRAFEIAELCQRTACMESVRCPTQRPDFSEHCIFKGKKTAMGKSHDVALSKLGEVTWWHDDCRFRMSRRRLKMLVARDEDLAVDVEADGLHIPEGMLEEARARMSNLRFLSDDKIMSTLD